MLLYVELLKTFYMTLLQVCTLLELKSETRLVDKINI